MNTQPSTTPPPETNEERYIRAWGYTGMLNTIKREELIAHFLDRFIRNEPYIYLGKEALDSLRVIELLQGKGGVHRDSR